VDPFGWSAIRHWCRRHGVTCAALVPFAVEHERGRVSAAANALLGGAQGISLLAGGAVAAVLPPRGVYAVAGLLGAAAAAVVGLVDIARASGRSRTTAEPPRGA
jgi:hypothetical protein